ncbi:polysaccharide biosynthesis protein, partial [Longibaculum muris]|uniref:polysaccharide biosynthesis protein n=1 Tax=Longibaculum muris TaxID=1796628 RepID=UPI0022DF3BC7
MSQFKDKVLMITGGTGSFGNAVLNRFLNTESCEFFPVEAVKTNVLGTENVLTAAIECGVKKVVCLSTDKAAYPVNAMGTSKAMMEKVIVAK